MKRLMILISVLCASTLLYAYNTLYVETTSDGIKSYAISSVENLTFPNGNFSVNYKAGGADIYSESDVTRLFFSETLPADETEAAQSITLYPSPTTGPVYISGYDGNELSYRVLRLDGVTLLSGTLENSSVIDLSPVESGLYIVVISTGETFKIEKR